MYMKKLCASDWLKTSAFHVKRMQSHNAGA